MADLRLQVIMDLANRASAPLRKISKGSADTARSLKETRDKLKELESTQRDVGRFRELRQGLTGTRTQLDATQNRVRDLAQQMAQASKPSRELTRQFNAARREASQLGERLKTQGQQAQQLRDRLQAAGVSTRNLGTHERTLRSQITSTTTAIQRQTDALKRQDEQRRKLDALRKRHGQEMMHTGMATAAGYGSMAAGRAAGRAGAGFLSEGVDFDAQMSRVQALARLDGGSSELAELRKQAKQLGADTMFSATQAAQGQAFLAMAGFNPTAIKAAMPGLLDMAKAGDMDLGRGADISSNILSAFGIDPSKMGRVADVLTKTFTTSNVTLEMLGDTMKYVGPVARAAGVDLETVSAMAGLLGNVGIQGQKGGTALRAMLLRLSAPTAGAAKAIQALGIKTADAQGNVRPLVQLLGEIATKTEKLGSAQRLDYLKAIFGEEPAAAMAELISQAGSDGINRYLASVRDSQGAAAQTAKIMANNMVGDLDELSSAWADVRIGVNEVNTSWLRATTQGATEMLRGISRLAQENPTLVKGLSMAAFAIVGLMTVGGALVLGLGLMVGKMLVVRFLLAQIGVRFSLWTVAMRGAGAVLGGLRTGIVWLARVALPMLWAGLGKVAAAVLWVGRALMFTPIGRIIALVMLLASAATWVYRNWDRVKLFFSGLWQSITTGLQGLWQSFKQLGGMLMDGLVSGITSRLGAVRDAITGAAGSAIGWFKDKLGIKSPSRVFMVAGQNVGEGAAIGIRRSTDLVRRASVGLATAGALGLPAAAMADAGALRIDQRPPLSAGSATAPVVVQGDTITIQITAAPGADPQALARAISAELDRRERNKLARARSALSDID